VTSKCLYKIMHGAYDSIKTFKARILVRGLCQIEGVEFEEIFYLVSMYSSIQVFISISLVIKWRIHQMDVKTIFLNMIIEE